MSDELVAKLRKAGLTGNEAKVYYELLLKTQLSANELAKNIGMDRTLVYTVLNNLTEKSMVGYVVKSNKRLFSPSSPDNLLNPVKEQEVYIEELLPHLKSLEKSVGLVQDIAVYEGKSGIRAFSRLLLQYDVFDSFGATGKGYDLLIESPRLAKELESKKVKIRLITHPENAKHPMRIKGSTTRFLKIKSEATTTIFGDYVAIHVVQDKPSVILIRNSYISNTYKAHFNILWDAAQRE